MEEKQLFSELIKKNMFRDSQRYCESIPVFFFFWSILFSNVSKNRPKSNMAAVTIAKVMQLIILFLILCCVNGKMRSVISFRSFLISFK